MKFNRRPVPFFPLNSAKIGLAIVAACFCSTLVLFVEPSNSVAAAEQEFFELRIYKVTNEVNKKSLLAHLEKAYLPALNRMAIDRVGVFSVSAKKVGRDAAQDDANSVVVLIPFKTIDQFTNLRVKLAADEVYQAAAKEHFDRKLNDPVFKRVESRFMKAFVGMPVIEQPKYSKEKKDRIFELRLYESHTEHHANLKVEMFNEGEIDLMRDVKMGPVFYGETLIGPTVPNLVYMLSAENAAAHAEHWQAFIKSPVWAKMSKMERYKGTVSKIVSWTLSPTSFSQL